MNDASVAGKDSGIPRTETVSGFLVRLDLAYDPRSRTWLEPIEGGRVRIGLDPVEVEASGTVAALSLPAPGSVVRRGGELGSLEAEKFVGPLLSPVSGTVTAVNDQVLARPSEVDRDPYLAWLVELAPDPEVGGPVELVQGADAVRAWFEQVVVEYRQKGVLAE
ncbi:MAG TPA: glycine cleavage system protein H [Candidatus Dormibacteraeota bacterium]|nr:glycine cleavage system protein H [Candidatus Dormibacteraeota bacterium]